MNGNRDSLDPRVPRLAGAAPVLGNLLEFRRDRFAALSRLRREAGDVAAVRFGPREVLIVSKPEVVLEVLGDATGAFEKGINYGYLRQLLGEGLVTSEGERHRRQRKRIVPLLAPRRAAGAVDAFVDAAERRVAGWSDGASIDVAAEMHALALEGMSRALCGGAIAFDAAEIGHAFRAENHWAVDLAAGVLRTDLARWLPRRRRLARSIAGLNTAIDQLIVNRRANPPPEPADVLDGLLATKDEDGVMTDREVRDEAVTLLFAGHETIASALGFSLWHLSRSPEIAGHLAADPSFAKPVMEEAMRLHPPVPLVGRRATREVSLGGFRVPRGQVVYVDLHGLHRRAELFSEPERFDPSRARPSAAFLPFSTGPRACAGASLAMAQGQAVLSAVARTVAVEPIDSGEPVLAVMVTLFARDGIPLRVRRRSAGMSQRAS